MGAKIFQSVVLILDLNSVNRSSTLSDICGNVNRHDAIYTVFYLYVYINVEPIISSYIHYV